MMSTTVYTTSVTGSVIPESYRLTEMKGVVR